MEKIYEKLSMEEEKLIKKSFPYFNTLLGPKEKHPSYKNFAVSVFDHWLTEEEAEELLRNVSPEEQHRRDMLHNDLLKKIYENTPVYTIRHRSRRKKNKQYFRKYHDIDALMKETAFDPRKKYINFFHLILPEMEAFYRQSWDDTNLLYYLNPQKIEILKKWIAESGLHILELAEENKEEDKK